MLLYTRLAYRGVVCLLDLVLHVTLGCRHKQQLLVLSCNPVLSLMIERGACGFQRKHDRWYAYFVLKISLMVPASEQLLTEISSEHEPSRIPEAQTLSRFEYRSP